MKNTNKPFEYLMYHILGMASSFHVYKAFCFQSIPGYGYHASLLILYAIVIATVASLFLLSFRKSRNDLSICFHLLLGFSLYEILCRFPFLLAGMLVFQAMLLAFSILACFTRLSSFPVSPQLKKLGILAMAALLLHAHAYPPLARKLSQSFQPQDTSQYTIANNLDVLACLEEETWQSLEESERLFVLQTVANIEQRYLGLPVHLEVVAKDTEEHLCGFYNDSERAIVINRLCLMQASAKESLDTICHEACHAYQHRLVEAFESNESLQELLVYRKARRYCEEFHNYANGKKDYDSYYFQQCEIDAREYAAEAVQDYYARIEKHLGNAQSFSEG